MKSCIATLLAVAWISARPAPFCRIEDNTPVQVNQTVFLRVDCDAVGTLFRWDFGDGVTDSSLQFSTTHVYTAPGRYFLSVQASLITGDTLMSLGIQNVVPSLPPASPVHSTSILWDEAGRRVWSVNPDNHSVVFLTWPGRIRSPEIRVGRKPRNLALDGRGLLWICSQEDAAFTAISLSTARVTRSIALPRASRPFGIVIDTARGFAFVSLQALNAVARVDLATGSISQINGLPGARGLALTHDGRRLLVTRFLSGPATAEISEMDGTTLQVIRRFDLPQDRTPDTDLGGSGVLNALNAVVIHPGETFAWYTAKKDNVGRGMFRDGRTLTPENTVRTLIGALDLRTQSEIQNRRIDLDNRSMAKAVAFTRLGAHAFVASEGSNTVDVLNALNYSMEGAIAPGRMDRELSPQGLCLTPDDSILFVQFFTSREIGAYDVSSTGKTNSFPLLTLVSSVDADSLDSASALGQRVFYNAADGRMNKSAYMSCAACHMEGMSDERVWDFTERGEGLRNTTTLLGKAGLGAGPLHWSANFDEVQDFEHDMRGPMGGLGFLPDSLFTTGSRNTTLGGRKAGYSRELDALAAYLTSLATVPPSPFRNPDGSLTTEALQGQAIFQRSDVGCAKCHYNPEFTDSKISPTSVVGDYAPFHAVVSVPGGFILHDVGTLRGSSGKRLNDSLRGLDTPPLNGIWATAPYLHDGSASTLLEVLGTYNTQDRHGSTSQLTMSEKQSLVAYLLQLEEIGNTGSGIHANHEKADFPGSAWKRTRNGIEFRINGLAVPDLWIFNVSGNRIAHFPPDYRWNQSGKGWTLHWRVSDRVSGIHFAEFRSGFHRGIFRIPLIQRM